MPTLKINTDIECVAWEKFPEISTILYQISYKTLQYIKFFDITELCEISVLLGSNKDLQELNSEFRHKDTPTNVLSFPSLPLDYRTYKHYLKNDTEIYLGDVAISYQQTLLEAEEANIPFIYHFTHLIVHSILHLLGYDHMNEEDANVMENLEIEILSSEFNIPNPYNIQ